MKGCSAGRELRASDELDGVPRELPLEGGEQLPADPLYDRHRDTRAGETPRGMIVKRHVEVDQTMLIHHTDPPDEVEIGDRQTALGVANLPEDPLDRILNGDVTTGGQLRRGIGSNQLTTQPSRQSYHVGKYTTGSTPRGGRDHAGGAAPSSGTAIAISSYTGVLPARGIDFAS
jgi:hypothetical protein